MHRSPNTRIVFRLATALAIAAAVWQSALAESNPLAELLHRAEARKNEDGLCKAMNWPSGDDYNQYARFLDAAVVGMAKVNTLNKGKNCQYDQVTRITYDQGRKCVEYLWYACVTGQACDSGTSVRCKQPDGLWRKR